MRVYGDGDDTSGVKRMCVEESDELEGYEDGAGGCRKVACVLALSVGLCTLGDAGVGITHVDGNFVPTALLRRILLPHQLVGVSSVGDRGLGAAKSLRLRRLLGFRFRLLPLGSSLRCCL